MWSNVKFCETLKFCGAELQIIFLALYVLFIKQVKRDHFGNFSQYNLLLNPWLCTATRVFCRRISSFYPCVSSGNRKWLLYDSHTEFLLTSRQFSLSRVVLLSTKDPLSVDISFKILGFCWVALVLNFSQALNLIWSFHRPFQPLSCEKFGGNEYRIQFSLLA